MASCVVYACSTCSERFPQLTAPASTECAHCSRDSKKRFSSRNGMDPGEVPPPLQSLTQVEEMLISAVMPMMSVYRLPLGQYGYRGHVINLPQDISSFATSLPWLPTDLDIIVVRKEGTLGSHRDFRVRRSRILSALQWLKENNRYYHAITIVDSALAKLPEDGDIAGVSTVSLPLDSDDHITDLADAEDDLNMSCTFVPVGPRRQVEHEVVRQSIASYQQPGETETPTAQWPEIQNAPINEFKTEGYMTCAFPTLFPTGEADFAAPRLHRVTIGEYFKHLLLYKDGRFATHPRFRFFALNTEMRWRALQAGNIYVRQHAKDAQLTVQELKDMVGVEGEAFSSRVLHFATSLRGTSPYWYKQRTRLIAMVDTLGLPTVFITHSAADLQWPELARLICPEHADDRSTRSQAVVDNPAVADWFFYQRITLFLKEFYEDVLGVKDYWIRFEWQHCGSPHIHGLAWLGDAPSIVQDVLPDDSAQQQIVQYVDSLVSTSNPSLLEDGGNACDAMLPQTSPHVCSIPFSSVDDFEADLRKLIATCQRHTRCSTAYCLVTKHGEQQYRFGYPKPVLEHTSMQRTDNGDIELLTKRNDPFINSYNPIQLSAWRANVDMQYCVSKNKVIAYCAKYATKCEPRSQPLKQVYKTVIGTLKDDDHALKAVHKLLLNSVGERDFSAQETCHLVLQLPLVMSTREFVFLSLDGTRMVKEKLDEDQPATTKSHVDHYISRPATPEFESLTLLHFTQNFSMSPSGEPTHRRKQVVVIVRPHFSPDPAGPNYDNYCRQKLMLHRPYRVEQQLLDGHDTFTEAYACYLQTGSIPPCLEDDIHRLEQQSQHSDEVNDHDEADCSSRQHNTPDVEEWMLICQHQAQLGSSEEAPTTNVDWLKDARSYPNLQEAATFLTRCKNSSTLTQGVLIRVIPSYCKANNFRCMKLLESMQYSRM